MDPAPLFRARHKHSVLDGHAVALGVDGISDLNALHFRKDDHEVQFCAFEILEEPGSAWRAIIFDCRRTDRPSHPPIFVTGYSPELLPVRFQCVRRCEKPVHMSEVLEKVGQLFDRDGE